MRKHWNRRVYDFTTATTGTMFPRRKNLTGGGYQLDKARAEYAPADIFNQYDRYYLKGGSM